MRAPRKINQYKKMETDTLDKQNTADGASNAPNCSLMLVFGRELDRYQPHTNCRRAIQRTIDACKEVGLLTGVGNVQTASTEPETDACYARAGMMMANQVDELDATCRKLENERNRLKKALLTVMTHIPSESWAHRNAAKILSEND